MNNSPQYIMLTMVPVIMIGMFGILIINRPPPIILQDCPRSQYSVPNDYYYQYLSEFYSCELKFDTPIDVEEGVNYATFYSKEQNEQLYTIYRTTYMLDSNEECKEVLSEEKENRPDSCYRYKCTRRRRGKRG